MSRQTDIYLINERKHYFVQGSNEHAICVMRQLSEKGLPENLAEMVRKIWNEQVYYAGQNMDGSHEFKYTQETHAQTECGSICFPNPNENMNLDWLYVFSADLIPQRAFLLRHNDTVEIRDFM